MAWVKVPPENHPIFRAALPADPRVETQAMFGGVAAKVNGNLFAGLFGRSTMIWLPDAEREAALRLEGFTPFDPMGDGRMRSDKIMLPERFMRETDELRRWVKRSFEAALALPAKAAKPGAKPKPAAKKQAPKVAVAAKRVAKSSVARSATPKKSATAARSKGAR